MENEIKIDGKIFTCCNGGGDTGIAGHVHVPIYFEGRFSALCPLCAQAEKTAEMEERAETIGGEVEEELSGEVSKAQDLADAKISELEALAEDAAELLNAARAAAEHLEILETPAAVSTLERLDAAISKIEKGRHNGV
jgi:hypothetical protein